MKYEESSDMYIGEYLVTSENSLDDELDSITTKIDIHIEDDSLPGMFRRATKCIENADALSLYSLSTALLGYTRIVISVYNVSKEECSFLHKTLHILKERLPIPVEISQNMLCCTHLIIASSSHRECKVSCPYLLGILFGKSMVNFNWYLSLFSDALSIETATLLNIVRSEMDITDAAEMSSIYGMHEGFFSNVNISGQIAEKEKRLVYLLNGTADRKSKRLTVKIDTHEELFYLITSDSSKPWYLSLFPGRSCIHRMK
ncbi:hypothetical protein NEMIN01_1133 [Nematocida minor]|uniref:uncharacterized protein n=1 Tax=Nematocida minor TaxID=1912983 RepID=UPI00221ECFDD|nr:uncharacterized protein NEMIN01_1133 [Nematocida minor]KAI5190668.1 hypothetical protein NEMIN01_1133 [Nematocida minor]